MEAFMNLQKGKETTETPAETVIGWLMVFLSFLVMSLGFNNGEVTAMFWVGFSLIPFGIIFVVIGKQKKGIQEM